MNNEIIQLILKVAGTDAVDRLGKSTDNYRKLLEDLTRQLSAGEISVDEYQKRLKSYSGELEKQETLLRSLIAAQQAEADALDPVRHALDEIEQSSGRAARGNVRLAEATEGVTRSKRNMGRTMLETGRIVQDFSQGGIAGILNNIEGLTVALGMGAGLAGVLTIVGVAAALAGPKLIDFARSLATAKTDTDNFLTAAEKLEKAHKANTAALDELKEKTSLTAAEARKLKELTEQQAEIEAKLAAQRETEANKKRFGPDSSPLAKNQAEAVRRALEQMGGYDATIGQILDAGTSAGEITADERDNWRAIFEDLLNQAIGGDEKAVGSLRHYGQRFGGGAGFLSGRIDELDPAKTKERELAEAKAKQESEERTKEMNALMDANRKFGDEALKQESREAEAKQRADADWEAEAKRQRDQIAREEKAKEAEQQRAVAEQARALEQTGLGAQARGAVVEMAAMGANQQQAFDRLAGELARRLTPSLGAAAPNVARQIAGDAVTDVNQQLTGMMAQGVNQQEALLAIGNAQAAQVAALMNRLDRNEAAVGQLWQRVNNNGRRLQARTRTASAQTLDQ